MMQRIEYFSQIIPIFKTAVVASYLALMPTAYGATIISNGNIYTMDQKQPLVEAIVFERDKILFVGGLKSANLLAGKNAIKLDLKGRTLTPGIIEGHGHIMSLGMSKLILDLSHAKNYDDVIQQVADAVKDAKPGEWIQGRGWHQSKWVPQPKTMVKGFQTHEALSAVSPANPVFLVHASGHAGMANAAAMEIAGINSETEFKGDGEVIKDSQLKPTGVFNEIAQSLIKKTYTCYR